MQITTRSAFVEYAKTHNRYLVQGVWDCDLFTPVLLAKILESPFLFESVEKRGKWSRYTFMGIEANSEIQVRQGTLYVDGVARTQKPLDYLDSIFQNRGYGKDPQLPDFSGGYVGHISYDAARFFEKLPRHRDDQLGLPEIHLFEFHKLLVIDNWDGMLRFLFTLQDESEYDAAFAQLTAIGHKLRTARVEYCVPRRTPLRIEQQFPRDQYEASVEAIQKEIFAGEIIQAVLSQRIIAHGDVDPFTLYRALRRINPSPYTFYLDFGSYRLVGASPEMHLKVKDDTAYLRPIAGTRRIAPTPEQNQLLEKDLKGDPKEISEHVMLVDLARNDLGRFCQTGSVKVTELMIVEHYSHVMHMVSNVVGTVDAKQGKGLLSMLGDTFPAGTVSGAPKIRAMEIIAEHESIARNVYSGVVGYFDYNGNMDTAIAIRTMIHTDDQRVIVQAGAGIVAESEPDKEYEECHNKAAALLKAIEAAVEMEDIHVTYDR
ncbi:anthranilate synthase component I family protein [Chrysiogenes arsenatis]|uniref:anthranilate synthase component I family protein n=1 Tax=Chrysiogenes arsenatis TaxID=309797 RepID=UPI00040FEF53|nr:anthranilate synthase component I family protein [Chrysiogenes arsenatis]